MFLRKFLSMISAITGLAFAGCVNTNTANTNTNTANTNTTNTNTNTANTNTNTANTNTNTANTNTDAANTNDIVSFAKLGETIYYIKNGQIFFD